ncbi:MAG: 2,3-bisphosphoglycerate-independent phosphoglycerate mutase [Candidatus Saliniplasma sp.]
MADKVLMLILDGLGDRPVEELGGKTPLEKAYTPNLDELSKDGINGIMDTISPGVIPGSDTGHLALLGYDPYEVYTGRGPFEAAGIGLDVKPDQIAFRCNFGTIEDGVITDRRAGRIKKGTKELAEDVNNLDLEVDFHFQEAVEHRGVLILKGDELGSDISDVDPHETGVEFHKAVPIMDTKENRRTAEVINDFTEKTVEVLFEHPINKDRMSSGKKPANIILSRGVGAVPKMKPLTETKNIKGAAIAGIPLVKGVCRLAGMDILDIDGATGGLDTDMDAIMEGIVSNIKEYDFILANIKAFDLLGHDGLPGEKTKLIEKLDKNLERLMNLEDTYIVISGDHSTPVTVKGHSGDPSPIVIRGKEVRKDDVESFGERSCTKGGLGRIYGTDVLNILLDLAKRGEKFGA